jgi:hypothetical protein
MKDKKILFQTIQDNLEWIDRTDEMIALHRKNDSGQFMIIQYEEKRREFLEELAELLSELNIKIPDNVKNPIINDTETKVSYPSKGLFMSPIKNVIPQRVC